MTNDYDPQSPEAQALAAQLAEQERIDAERRAEVERAARQRLIDLENERDRNR